MPSSDAPTADVEGKIAAANLDETRTVDEAIERLIAQGMPRRSAATYAAHHHGTFRGDLRDPAADPAQA